MNKNHYPLRSVIANITLATYNLPNYLSFERIVQKINIGRHILDKVTFKLINELKSNT